MRILELCLNIIPGLLATGKLGPWSRGEMSGETAAAALAHLWIVIGLSYAELNTS